MGGAVGSGVRALPGAQRAGGPRARQRLRLDVPAAAGRDRDPRASRRWHGGRLGELAEAPLWGLVAFALAGLVHFFVGWTTLNFSQARIGAARTSPLLSTAPVFGLVFAARSSPRSCPDVAAIGGIALTIGGAYLVSDPGGGRQGAAARLRLRPRHRVRLGAEPDPHDRGPRGASTRRCSGSTLGMFAAALAYGALLAVTADAGARLAGQPRGARAEAGRRGRSSRSRPGGAGSRSTTPTSASCSRCSCSRSRSVLVLAPLISGRHVEIVTRRSGPAPGW